ncbi:MAG TPA: hypothetical protein VN840_22135 [Streptosporangiaceae bacterium]|nr:hypothetical protein [Streptosporangiaceae bacterium]
MRMPQPATEPAAPGDPASGGHDGPGDPADAQHLNGGAPAGDAPAGDAPAGDAPAGATLTDSTPAGATLTDSTPAGSASAGRQRGYAPLALAGLGLIRRHWLASALLTAGLALRVATQMAYHPAIVYIDSLKYLYGAWPGADPVGYKIPLKLILAFGDLGTVALIQHLLGLAIAVTIYVVLLRRGAPRWLGALAMAPVLLDGYQLQAEHMIMPDVWFEAMIVAGLAVLLWDQVPRLRMLIIGSLILGGATGLRQAGEILIVPALILAIALGGGWRKVLGNMFAAGLAFVVAVGLYMVASAELTGHFRVSESSNSLTYGRMASVANCATLRLPAAERPLCPSPAEQAKGPDRLDHDATSPLKVYRAQYLAHGGTAGAYGNLVAKFNRAVERQQPLRVISGIWRDAVKLFAVSRVTSSGDTPIWRWQFQGNFPSYLPYILIRHNAIVVALPQSGTAPNGQPLGPKLEVLKPAYGGAPQVDKPIADFLRSYQLGGGYTPGPLLLLFTLTGLAGSLLAFARRRLTPERRQLVFGCVAFFSAAVAILAISDAFEFTWRYQLPALVTLPPAGALGIGALIAFARRSRRQATADAMPERAAELATPAT